LSAPLTHERRRSPRRRVSREARLSVSPELFDPSVAGEGSTALTFFGSTRDISATGFAVAVPYLNVEVHCAGANFQSIPVILYLPAAQVRLRAIPVRVEPLNSDDPSEGCLIGADVTDLDESGSAILNEYLRQAG
jgi:hypothetical protein